MSAEADAKRKNVMLGTAGHVDHGKTALVKLLTGCDTDRLAAEKQRGLTIELGFAPCSMADGRIVGIVDVPGHVDFIRNMVAGAHGVDVVILVVAADDGVMPQTREHLDILTLMGARRGLVALTKMDLVDEELRELVVEDVRELLGGTFLERAPVCPMSNITGEGFGGFFEALNGEVNACEPIEATGLFRLWIERAFSIRGFGTVASGIPTGGCVRVGDRLRLLPDGPTGRVRHMEVYGREAEAVRAGECVGLNLADIDAEALQRGKTLCEPGAFEPVRMAEAELKLLASVPVALKDYAQVHLHVGTAERMAHVALLAGKELPPGQAALVQLRLGEPLSLAPGERFVIRGSMAGLAGGRVTTLGGGRILGASNIRLRRNRPWTLEALAARREAIDDPGAWCALHLKEARQALTAGEVAQRAQVPADRAAALLEGLRAEGVVLAAGPRFVHRDTTRQVQEGLVAALEGFHAANPTRLGIAETELRAQVEAEPGLFDLAMAELAANGTVAREGTVVALSGRAAKLPPEDQALAERIEAALREAGLAPPGPAELAEALGQPERKVAELVCLLVDQGKAVRVDATLILHAEAVGKARQIALELFRKSGSFTTVEFRDAVGVSRKYAVPLLDYFDTVRLTVRSGSRRTPGAEARKMLGQA